MDHQLPAGKRSHSNTALEQLHQLRRGQPPHVGHANAKTVRSFQTKFFCFVFGHSQDTINDHNYDQLEKVNEDVITSSKVNHNIDSHDKNREMKISQVNDHNSDQNKKMNEVIKFINVKKLGVVIVRNKKSETLGIFTEGAVADGYCVLCR